MGKGVLCPVCGSEMDYVIEVEKTGSVRRITRYYRCPACGTKIIDEKFEVRLEEDKIIVRSLINGAKPVIKGRRPRRRHPGARALAR